MQVKIEKKYTKYNLEMTRGALADYHNYNQNENNGKISILFSIYIKSVPG